MAQNNLGTARKARLEATGVPVKSTRPHDKLHENPRPICLISTRDGQPRLKYDDGAVRRKGEWRNGQGRSAVLAAVSKKEADLFPLFVAATCKLDKDGIPIVGEYEPFVIEPAFPGDQLADPTVVVPYDKSKHLDRILANVEQRNERRGRMGKQAEAKMADIEAKAGKGK